MLNKYPLWKNLLLLFLTILAFIYALPNVYGDDPALQITLADGKPLNPETLPQLTTLLKEANIRFKSKEFKKDEILFRFFDADEQLKAKDFIKSHLGEHYTVALNIASSTPSWLRALGAEPMKLGLDLRGGIHLTLAVDMDSVLTQRVEGITRNIATQLRESNIRYQDIVQAKNGTIDVKLNNESALNEAKNLIQHHFPEWKATDKSANNVYTLTLQRNPQMLADIRQGIIEQTMTTLRNRVNELGIAEAVVQQQGLAQISVDLPGIQDSARAQEILGGTATLEFRMVDQEHDAYNAAVTGNIPASDTLYDYEGQKLLLKNQIILTGSSITNASAGYSEDGRPAVNVQLGGGGEALFHRITAQNIGKLMAIVYVETKTETKIINGIETKAHRKNEHIISAATIRSALPNQFQISGINDQQESVKLSLLLRAGALPANIDVVEERTLGPKLGIENIKKGILSIEVGMGLVMLFLAFYYRVFGLIANVALLINLVMLLALLSILGMTLTLPGIAGIVLTVGMAVDANVLIFERIREELRQGTSIQGSIYAGYERAFSTIVDANITTLIVAFVLFGVGAGAVKGFAVTLSIGILTSMLTAIAASRALVNIVYGKRPQTKKLSIGI
ncbi:MAG: Protein translocase subunit SecD [Legionellaceae bacterium]